MKSYTSKLNVKRLLFFTFFSLFQLTINAQDFIEGQVFRATDSTSISGASVYFDGTSIGVISNEKGAFKIPYTENNSLLVISYLGCEPLVINTNEPAYKKKSLYIYLDDKLEALDAVQLEVDPWSRIKKLKLFRTHFIGKYPTWKYCKIMNEDDVNLKYIPSSQVLVASAKNPIVVKNKKLGYEITYNLIDFEVSFKKSPGGILYASSTYYEGTSFFKPLKKRTSKKVIANREKSFLGSTLHFYRSIYQRKLDENHFKIFHKRFLVDTYKYFSIIDDDNMKNVTLHAEEIDILYKDEHHSSFKAKRNFYIDQYGNHFPPDAVTVGGVMSQIRLAETLPLDYKQQ
ncbi:hypothetical protein SCB49_14270 [unidentified eubacterium SCB49]|nr:hypothetical protein SCB49_14270 [unidentified eubacterium SCB49]